MAIKRKIQVRRGAAADRPTLSSGEFGLDTDTGSEALYIGTPAGNVQIARQSALPDLTTKADGIIGGYCSIATALTRYIYPFSDGLTQGTSANNALCWAVPRAGTIKNLAVRSVFGNTNSATVTLYKNGSATTLTCATSGNAGSSASDLTHTVSVSAGDLLEWQIVTTSANGSTNRITMEIYYT